MHTLRRTLTPPFFKIAAVFALGLFLFPGETFAQETLENLTAKKASSYKFSLTSGVYFSSGDYGQTVNTDVLYIPVTARVKKGQWTAEITVPYLEITGPGVVLGGGDDSTVTGTNRTKATQKGLGDIMLGFKRTLTLNQSGTFARLGGKVKLPTADEDKRLGTGETDYIVETDLIQTYKDLYLIGKAGYKFAGDSADNDLENSWRFSAGAGYKFTKGTTLGFSYTFREASSKTGPDQSELMAYGQFSINDQVSIQPYGTVGLQEGSPDFALGSMLKYKFELQD